MLLVACGGDDTVITGASGDISGSYSLQTVNSSPLPYTIQSGANSATLLSDSLVVGSNGTWTESSSYTQTVNGQTTSGIGSDGGTWVQDGANVTFAAISGCNYAGTFSSGTITVSDCNGLLSVFTR